VGAGRSEVFRSAIYRGQLTHTRKDNYARRAFGYPVYFASIDLDEIAELDRGLRLFSYNRRNLFSLNATDYEAGRDQPGRDAAMLRRFVHQRLAAEGLPIPAATRLVTNLAVAGYVFNPVSFFVNYDDNARISTVIAEVNNTYGGRFLYLLHHGNRVFTSAGSCDQFHHPREFFVSPFLHGNASYDFLFDLPLDGDSATIQMDVKTAPAPGSNSVVAATNDDSSKFNPERIFVAHLGGQRIELSDRSLAKSAALSPLMPMQVIGLIHLQAMKLRRLGVPYLLPKADHRPRHY
jgi:uncharacterized protein